MDAETCLKGFLLPEFELLNVILAVINFAPIHLSISI